MNFTAMKDGSADRKANGPQLKGFDKKAKAQASLKIASVSRDG